MNRETRVASLDGLRGIAAVAVVGFHFDVFFLPQAGLSRLVPGLNLGYLAVDVFFLLSGFVMAHVYGHAMASSWRARWLDFARARFARIYPLFALTTSAMLIAVTVRKVPLTLVSLSESSLALQPFLLQSLWPGLSWNYPSWSLSTEAGAYIFFVFAARWLLTGRYPRLITVGCGAIVTAMSMRDGGTLNYFHGGFAMLRTLSEFTLGVMLFRTHVSGVVFPRNWLPVLIAILVCSRLLIHQDCLLVAAAAGLILHAIGAPNIVSRILNSRPLVALGDWSYSIYLWHAPMHYAVMAALAANGLPVSELAPSGARLLLVATLVAVIGLSALSYRYFETPMRRLLHSPRPALVEAQVIR
jgi:peptidoglycan/LPS O-acetylase OafA/YrhL